MADKTIMLACSAGMSTSLLVSKMQNAAKEKGKDYKIFATAASGIQEFCIHTRLIRLRRL